MHGPGIMLTILQTHVGGFPNLGFRGTNLGVPRIRIVGFGGSRLGSPYLWKLLHGNA